MDNETAAGPVEPSLPKSSVFSAIKTAPPAAAMASAAGPTVIESSDRNGVFRHLVSDDSDITGLVAYSIYKQNKLDWLSAFETAKGRSPEDAELASYIIGEGTPRRLATYRHLAEATLAGHGPDVEGGQRSTPRRKTGQVSAVSPALIATYVGIAILFGIGFWLAAHFTMASR